MSGTAEHSTVTEPLKLLRPTLFDIRNSVVSLEHKNYCIRIS